MNVWLDVCANFAVLVGCQKGRAQVVGGDEVVAGFA